LDANWDAIRREARTRTKALVRHARAVDTIFDMQERGGRASPEQVKELQEARQLQYQAGDMAGFKATNSAMDDMAKSLQRDPQLESILAKPQARTRHRRRFRLRPPAD
jgi:hypothetical protein